MFENSVDPARRLTVGGFKLPIRRLSFARFCSPDFDPQKALDMAQGITAAGVTLDLDLMQLDDNTLAGYSDRIATANAQMAALEAGEAVNTDEGRQVGHYWLRNPDIAPAELQEEIKATWAVMSEFATEQFAGRFQNILWIGIGGSGLGPQLMYDALRVPGKTPSMYFFDNTDPFGFQRTLADIAHNGGLQQTLTVVVSKSGGTPETANGMKVAMAEYEKAGLKFADHAAAVTMSGSKLFNFAESWLQRFTIWDWVGGRTSLFSAVGLLPAALLGFDSEKFIAGARAMDDATRSDDLSANPALQLAATWYHTVETTGLKNMVVLPYCDRISMMAKYLQQLVMESIGKDGKGISVFGNKGSTDQHSYIQQLRDGYKDFFAVFLRVLDPEADHWEVEPGVTAGDYLMAFQRGTALALSETGRPSLCITVERFDESILGALIALFERTVGYYGAMLGVNSYHQPGVEAGKKAAGAVLTAQAAILKHAPADVAALTGDAAALQSFVETVQSAEGLESLSAQFVADLLHRFQVCGRLS